MHQLSNLKNALRGRKPRKVVGRGNGSGHGKTSCRGEKGAGSRSGYKRRYGYEGGQMRLFMKLPERGFNNVRFAVKVLTVNLDQIEKFYKDGEVVNAATLHEKGLIRNTAHPVKLLSNGEITKKVSFELNAISEGAQEKLNKAKLSFKVVE